MTPISEKTPVQIGLLLAIIGVFWWTLQSSSYRDGVTQTKLEGVQKSLDSITAKFPLFDASLGSLASRVQALEYTGSPALRTRLDAIEKEMIEVHRKLDAHILIDEPPKK